MENKKKKESGADWKKIVQVFVGDVLARVSDNISHRIELGIKKIKRKSIGLFFAIIGLIFLLISAAIFINTLLLGMAPWLGWGMIGILLVAIGYLMGRD